MAYVAISGELKERTKRIIRHMRQKEEQSVGSFTEKLTGDEAFLDPLYWGEHLHLKNTVPKDWLKPIHEVYAKTTFPVTNDEGATRMQDVLVTFDTEKPIIVPPNTRIHESRLVADDVPIMRNFLEHYKKETEVKRRWLKVENDVMMFLNTCKSLNEAVKLWPDVTMYIDKSDIGRMGVKREKARESDALAALAKLDTDMLVGAVVISRMSQAAA